MKRRLGSDQPLRRLRRHPPRPTPLRTEDLHVVEPALQEPGLGDREVELPQPPEAPVIAELLQAGRGGTKALAPGAQREHVGGRDVLKPDGAHIGLGGQAALHPLHRGKAAAGKDELVCETPGGLLRLVGAVVDADRLQEHQAVRLDQLRAAAEEEVEVLPPDRLDHLDRGELVEAALQLAVVGLEKGHSLLEAGGAHPTLRVVALLAGDRRRGDAAAVLPRGVDGEAAPAGADLEQVVVGAQLEAAADALELVALRFLERLVLVLKAGARVHHRLGVQEGLEHLVAEVVMGGDVSPCAALGVEQRQHREAVHRPGDGSETAPRRVEPKHLPGTDAKQGNQILGVPEPVGVALAEADAAPARDRLVEAGVVDADRRAKLGVGRAEALRPARVGLVQLDLPRSDPGEDGVNGAA